MGQAAGFLLAVLVAYLTPSPYSKGHSPMPTSITTFLAEVDAVLTLACKYVPGVDADSKKAAVHAFLNPRITEALAAAGASAFVTECIVSLLDFAIDAELAHATA